MSTTERDELLLDQVVALIVQRKQLTRVDLAGYTENLIKARVAELRSKRPNITLTIAGNGNDLQVYEPVK